MPEYCVAPGRRGNYRTRIYRQGLRYLKEYGISSEAILLLAHLTQRDFQTVFNDLFNKNDQD